MEKDRDPGISGRKVDHVAGALEYYKRPRRSYFDDYYVAHNALPEIDLEEVDSTCEFIGKKIAAPFMIGSLTGGPELASRINRNLAKAAQEAKIPLALGSAKIVFHQPDSFESIDVRDLCPDVPLIHNFGLVDLGGSFTIDDCRSLMKRTRADALIFHLNPLHEALQAEGNTNFKGLIDRLKRAVDELDFPIIVKEVGHGINPALIEKLDECGVYAIDVAGQGGTSWGFIEGHRATDPLRKRVCETFNDWGIPTIKILEQLSDKSKRKASVIASGGVRNGVDVFKSVCLGADIAAAAGAFLNPAMESAEAVLQELKKFITEYRLSMFATGCKDNSGIGEQLVQKF